MPPTLDDYMPATRADVQRILEAIAAYARMQQQIDELERRMAALEQRFPPTSQ